MAVSVANPGTISGVGVANPGRITGVSVANPAPITSVGGLKLGGTQTSVIPNNQTTSGYDSYIKATQDLIRSIQASNQEVYAPALNLSSISAQARAAAGKAVNPFYTKALNDFIKQQAYEKGQQQAQTSTDIQNLQDQLAQTLSQNQTQQNRTAQDVATNIGNINTQEDQFQTDSGTAYDQARLDQARQQAISGIAGGAAAGQQLNAQRTNATTEARQGAQFAQQRQQQDLYKARTFEDLARAGEAARTSTEKGKKQAQFNLDQFIKEQGFALAGKKTDLEIARQNALEQNAQKQGQLLVNKFIQSIANPAQRLAATKAYGGLNF